MVEREISQRDQSDFGRKAWIEQRMGNSMSKGTQRTKRKAVSGCGSDIFWSRTTLSDGIGGTLHSAESGRKEERLGDGMRRVWREFGKGDATWSGMDASPRRHESTSSPDSATVGNGQQHGGRGPLLAHVA